MQGLHLTADLHRCRCDPVWLTQAQTLGQYCTETVAEVGLQSVAQLFHTFPTAVNAPADSPGGITATLLLSESHLCIHTWPELTAVTLDVYVCNFGADHSAKALALVDRLIALFQPESTEQHRLQRGMAVAGAGA
jgi:S-adenosylmethionine decarboxylase